MAETCNGWKNYETWDCYNWLTNEEATYKTVIRAAKDARRHIDEQGDAAQALASALQTHIENNAPDLGASLYLDLLTAAISKIDFYEIAAAFMEDLQE